MIFIDFSIKLLSSSIKFKTVSSNLSKASNWSWRAFLKASTSKSPELDSSPSSYSISVPSAPIRIFFSPCFSAWEAI
jgi:hypothetical protein